MPRDSSGNYTLPAGNPVVTGTTVDSTWANDTMEDVRSAMQDSLSRSGDGGMLVAFKNADGSEASPGITFTNETTSGFYRAGTNDVRASIAGVDRARFRANSANPFQIWNGSAWTNVLYEASSATISGVWSFTANPNITNTQPIFDWVESDGAADNKRWRFSATGEQFRMVVRNDADSNGNNVFEVERTGIVVDSFNILATTVSVNGTSVRNASILNAGTLTDARVAASNVTQHEAALTIAESQITDGAVLARVGSTETITGTWTLDGVVTTADFGTGGRVKDGTDTSRPVGFNVMPVFENDANDDFDLAHNGMLWHVDSGAGFTYTCVNDGDIPQGATYVIANEDDNALTIADGSITLRWFAGTGSAPSTGDRTLARGGVCTVYKYSDTEFWIWGVGIS